MSSSTPILTYFDIRGLAEVPRLLLAAADVVYTDDRIPFTPGAAERPEFAARKAAGEFPYGQVPVFTFNGTKIPQSGAIIRFIAKQYHLDGDSNIEQALIDAGYEAVLDIRKGYFTARGDAAKVKTFWEETFPTSVGYLSKNIAGSPSAPFFVGKRLSYVDVAIYYLFWVLNTENSEAVKAVLAANPKVQALYNAVEKDEKIAKYLANRKETPM